MKRLVLFACILILAAASAFADPIPLLEDFTQDYILHYDESNPDAGHYEYVYHYPHVDPSAPGAAPIEKYYEDKDSDSQNFSMLINGDYYRESGISVKTEITYTITCNNDDYFSVLFKICDFCSKSCIVS